MGALEERKRHTMAAVVGVGIAAILVALVVPACHASDVQNQKILAMANGLVSDDGFYASLKRENTGHTASFSGLAAYDKKPQLNDAGMTRSKGAYAGQERESKAVFSMAAQTTACQFSYGSCSCAQGTMTGQCGTSSCKCVLDTRAPTSLAPSSSSSSSSSASLAPAKTPKAKTPCNVGCYMPCAAVCRQKPGTGKTTLPPAVWPKIRLLKLVEQEEAALKAKKATTAEYWAKKLAPVKTSLSAAQAKMNSAASTASTAQALYTKTVNDVLSKTEQVALANVLMHAGQLCWDKAVEVAVRNAINETEVAQNATVRASSLAEKAADAALSWIQKAKDMLAADKDNEKKGLKLGSEIEKGKKSAEDLKLFIAARQEALAAKIIRNAAQGKTEVRLKAAAKAVADARWARHMANASDFEAAAALNAQSIKLSQVAAVKAAAESTLPPGSTAVPSERALSYVEIVNQQTLSRRQAIRDAKVKKIMAAHAASDRTNAPSANKAVANMQAVVKRFSKIDRRSTHAPLGEAQSPDDDTPEEGQRRLEEANATSVSVAAMVKREALAFQRGKIRLKELKERLASVLAEPPADLNHQNYSDFLALWDKPIDAVNVANKAREAFEAISNTREGLASSEDWIKRLTLQMNFALKPLNYGLKRALQARAILHEDIAKLIGIKAAKKQFKKLQSAAKR